MTLKWVPYFRVHLVIIFVVLIPYYLCAVYGFVYVNVLKTYYLSTIKNSLFLRGDTVHIGGHYLGDCCSQHSL